MGKIIGIDLGTTNSVVAVMEGDEPKVIVNQEGDRTTPSIVAWAEDDEVLVGIAAKRQAITNPEGTLYSTKRFIGRRFSESDVDVKRMPYACVRRDNGDVGFRVRETDVAPPEVSAHILRKLKAAAEDYLGQPVTAAVITVPAYFNDSQRAMAPWTQTLGITVQRVAYEDMVADQAGESRKLIDAIGLEWDDACARFYEKKRSVRTASEYQVDQPIYTRSVRRHERYAEHLETLRETIRA